MNQSHLQDALAYHQDALIRTILGKTMPINSDWAKAKQGTSPTDAQRAFLRDLFLEANARNIIDRVLLEEAMAAIDHLTPHQASIIIAELTGFRQGGWYPGMEPVKLKQALDGRVVKERKAKQEEEEELGDPCTYEVHLANTRSALVSCGLTRDQALEMANTLHQGPHGEEFPTTVWRVYPDDHKPTRVTQQGVRR